MTHGMCGKGTKKVGNHQNRSRECVSLQQRRGPWSCVRRCRMLYEMSTVHGGDLASAPAPEESSRHWNKKGKGVLPHSSTEHRVPELIPVLGSQTAGEVRNTPGCRLPLLSARPTITPATLKRAATNFAAWWTEAQWVWTVCPRLLPNNVATATWTRALQRLSTAR